MRDTGCRMPDRGSWSPSCSLHLASCILHLASCTNLDGEPYRFEQVTRRCGVNRFAGGIVGGSPESSGRPPVAQIAIRTPLRDRPAATGRVSSTGSQALAATQAMCCRGRSHPRPTSVTRPVTRTSPPWLSFPQNSTSLPPMRLPLRAKPDGGGAHTNALPSGPTPGLAWLGSGATSERRPPAVGPDC